MPSVESRESKRNCARLPLRRCVSLATAAAGALLLVASLWHWAPLGHHLRGVNRVPFPCRERTGVWGPRSQFRPAPPLPALPPRPPEPKPSAVAEPAEEEDRREVDRAEAPIAPTLDPRGHAGSAEARRLRIEAAIATRQTLTEEEVQFFLERPEIEIVPWPYVHEWFRDLRFEPIAELFRRMPGSDRHLASFGKTRGGSDEAEGLARYLERHHPDLAPPLREEVDRIRELRERSAFIADLDPNHRMDCEELLGIWRSSERIELRRAAFTRLVREAPDDAALAAVRELESLFEREPRWETIDLARQLAPIVLASERPWVLPMVRDCIGRRCPVWQEYLFAVAERDDRESLGVLKAVEAECEGAMQPLVRRAIERIEAALFEQGTPESADDENARAVVEEE